MRNTYSQKIATIISAVTLVVLLGIQPLHAQFVAGTITVGSKPAASAVNPLTNTIYIGNSTSNTVTAINGATDATSTISGITSPGAMAINPVTNMVYVANGTGSTVTVINGATNAVTSTVTVGSSPRGLALNPITDTIYVANFSSNSVTVINGGTNTVTANVTVGTNPAAVAVDPVTDTIYVANESSNSVSVINGTTNTVTATVTVGTTPAAVAVDPVTDMIYVLNGTSNTVSVINGATNAVTSTVTVGSGPRGIALNPITDTIYVVNLGSGTAGSVSVINGETNAVTATVTVGTEAESISLDPIHNLIYVSNFGGTNVTVINGATNATTTLTVGANPARSAINPVTGMAYVPNNGNGTVSVIDGATLSTVAVAVGSAPESVAVNPASNLIYVPNYDGSSVSVINGATGLVETTVTAGTTPYGVAADPVTNMIYVANEASNNVTVVNGATNATTAVAVGVDPLAVAANPVTNTIYVANCGGSCGSTPGSVTVMNGATNATSTVNVGLYPVALAVNPATNMIYVANYDSATVTVINGATNATTTVNVGVNPYAVAVNPVTNMIYVANSNNGTVTVINGATNATTTVTVGNIPLSLAVNSITNMVYVANEADNTVSVISGATNAVTATVTIGSGPFSVAVNPVSNKIYVANCGPCNGGSSSLTVIDGLSNVTTTAYDPGAVELLAVAVNPVTNTAYAADASDNVLEVAEQQSAGANPLVTSIEPQPNGTTGPTPTFTLTTSDIYATPQAVWYQMDTWQGAWTQASGTAPNFTLTPSALSVGTHILFAFATDGQEASSTGLGQQLIGGMAAYVFRVIPATTTSVQSSANPSTYGQSIYFTATLTGSSQNLTGTVQFYIDGVAFGGPVTPVGYTAASGSTSTLAAGVHTVTATYSGDANDLGSTGTLGGGQVVNTAAAEVTVSSSANGSPSTYGQAVTFTATVSGQNGLLKKKSGATPNPTGTVTWSTNTGCGTTTVSGGNPGIATCTTSVLPPGSNSVTANYSGDSNHNPGSGSAGQTVTQASVSLNVTLSLSSEIYGQDAPITIAAQLTWSGAGLAPAAANVSISGTGPNTYGPTTCGSAIGDTITCTATYTPSSADAAGSYTESATFVSDGNYAGATSPQTGNFSILDASSSVLVLSGTNPSTYGQSLTLTAVVSGQFGATKHPGTHRQRSKTPDVSGSVTWSSNTGCGTTTVTPGNPGVATCNTSSLPAGTDTITASYSGDADHSGSFGTLTGGQVVNQASQTITFTTNAPASAVYGSNFTVAATASSGLGVAFTSAGGCTNINGTYTMTSGTTACSVIANQSGNSNYLAAPQVTQTVTATKANPTVTFTGLPSSLPYGNYTVIATTNASTTAVIASSTPTVCTTASTTVTVVAIKGTCTVTATWAADNNYNAAGPLMQSGTAKKGVATITWQTPAPITYGTELSSTQLDASASPSAIYPNAVYSPTFGKVEIAGDDTLKVTFTPTDTLHYSTSTMTVTLQVLQTATTTTITSSDQTVKISPTTGVATATMKYNVTSYKPTGIVTLTASTGETCNGAVAPATGDGSCKLTFSTTGTRTITATYAGDANHTGSNNSTQNPAVTVTVN